MPASIGKPNVEGKKIPASWGRGFGHDNDGMERKALLHTHAHSDGFLALSGLRFTEFPITPLEPIDTPKTADINTK